MNRLLIPLLLLTPLALPAAETKISNDLITVAFDDTANTFSIADHGASGPFVVAGRLGGEVKQATVKPTTDPVFGEGRQLLVTLTDGSTSALELYPQLRFVLVRTNRNNPTASEIDLQQVVPATFTLNLAKPASALTTLGTGGLLPPAKNPGSYLFLSCADPATRDGVVAGFISQQRGSGVLFSSVKNDAVEITTRLDQGHLVLPPGQSTTLDTLAIGHFTDARLGCEQLADAIARQHQIQLRPKTAVYCSWYAEGPGHGRAGNPATTRELARFIADRKLADYGLGVIQLDDGWQDGPQRGGPATEFARVSPQLNYRDGIAPVAKEVTDAGLTFGLWWLPFGRNHQEPLYQDKQDWFFKWPDGKPLRQRSFGGSCLDATHPAVREHLETLASTIRSWGVKYYKMDGLSAGAGVDHVYINDGYKADRFGESLPPHDRSKTQIEAMRLGLQTIRKGAGNDVFFSGCCAVQNMRIYAGSIGLVDSMRVGPDFNHDGEGIRSGPLRGSRMYFLNGKVWWNDPDPTKVRTSNGSCEGDPSINGGVTLEQARLTSSWVSLSNQFYLISDWLPYLPEERIDILKRTMAGHHAITRPVDFFDNSLPNTWLVTDTASGVRRDVIGVFNFYNTPLKVSHTFEKLGLDPAKTYHAYDFWSNQPLADLGGSYQDTIPANSCRVIALRAVENRPLLLSTSSHVTQGMVDVSNETWATNTLSGISTVIANDPYELRIRVPDGWALDQANATAGSAKDRSAELTPGAVSSPGLARISFTRPTNGPVTWRVSFKPVAMPTGVSLTHLKAAQAEPSGPVTLTWLGSTPFYEISRDGTVIAAGHYGLSFTDPTPPTPQTVRYTVKPLGGPAGASAQASVSLTTKVLESGPTPPAPAIRLSGLKPLNTTTGWGSFQVGKAPGGGPLKLSNQVYPDGISLHANGEAVYACQPGWRRFVATVGLDDSQRTDPRASIVCKVIAIAADGSEKPLLKTPLLASGGICQWNIDQPLPPGTSRLRLLVEDGGDGIAADHTDWVNAGFLTE